MQSDLSHALVTLHFAAPMESASAVFGDGGGEFPAASAAAKQIAAANSWRSIVTISAVSPQRAQLLGTLAEIGTLFGVSAS